MSRSAKMGGVIPHGPPGPRLPGHAPIPHPPQH